ncbi:hypothetical protein HYALB_00007513 [Hymenoscyphus albidus]|uniref:Dienelactone hydrolase domain-containing protein n=1 Tax=Hymenoscyphus albidus TaxID=595503 RepID=A0A9N9M1C8_9HELO|nr:hypothetical protein HYALB_00007513 [Hymenoscyphus albidus]
MSSTTTFFRPQLLIRNINRRPSILQCRFQSIRRTMASSTPAGKFEWLVILPDHEGLLEKRMEVRPTHFAGLKAGVESGFWKMGGAFLEDFPKEGEGLKMKGSAMIAIASSKEEVLEVLKNDIYAKSGVWNFDKNYVASYNYHIQVPCFLDDKQVFAAASDSILIASYHNTRTMADPEVATKAPESDAAETASPVPEPAPASLVPGDTPAQSGASLGEHCVTDRPTPSGKGPSGEMSQLGGVDVYISKPADYPHAPSKLLLFLTGATGLHSKNNQIQADIYAREGFLVVLPDMFGDDPLPGSATYSEEKDPSLIEQIKLRAAETAKSFLIDMWLARQTPEKVLPAIHKVIEAAKDEFADAVANGGGIYCAGYCFGARMTLLLAGEKPDKPDTAIASAIAGALGQQPVTDEEAAIAKNHGPFIKAGVIAHATLVTREDFEGTKVPVAFVCVENDQLFPDDIKEYGEKHLKENNVECEFKTYSGVPHGFGIVGEYEDAMIKAAQAEAFDHMLAWLKAH